MLQVHLRAPGLPPSWLRDAAEAPAVKANVELQAMIARHPNTPVDVRVHFIRILPLLVVMNILDQADAGADIRFTCRAHLGNTWAAMSPAGRRQFAEVASQPLWELVWSSADEPALAAFLGNPRLTPQGLAELIKPPLTRAQVEGLAASRFRASQQVIFQVLISMALTFREPGTDLVLGLAAPWIKALTPQERLLLAPNLSYPPLERLAELWGSRLTPPA